MRCRARAAWLAVALAAGCTEEAEPVSQPPPADPADAGRSEDVPPPVEMDPPECDEGLSARRVLAWPGGGVQVAITLSAPAFGGEIRVTAGGRAWTTAWASAAGEPGITAVLLAEPGGAAARDLVQTLPAGERVGLWQLADDGVELLSEVTHRRDHVLARLAEANPALAPAGPGVA